MLSDLTRCDLRRSLSLRCCKERERARLLTADDAIGWTYLFIYTSMHLSGCGLDVMPFKHVRHYGVSRASITHNPQHHLMAKPRVRGCCFTLL